MQSNQQSHESIKNHKNFSKIGGEELNYNVSGVTIYKTKKLTQSVGYYAISCVIWIQKMKKKKQKSI